MREQRSADRTQARHGWLEYLSSGILALFVATAVWIMAVYEQDPPKADSFEGIPIRYENIGEGLVLVGAVEERAGVTLRAPTSHWKALQPDLVQVSADLRGLGVGVHSVEVKATSLDNTAVIVKCSPVRVVVRLEEKVRREMTVRAEVADVESVPPGYATTPPAVNPSRITLSGPKSLVESVDEVVARVWLRGSKTAVQSQVVPMVVDKDGRQVQEVDLTPRTVSVTLGVAPLAEFRDVTVRAAVKGVPAAGYWVSNIVVEPATVTIQGPAETIGKMTAVVSTETIDVTGVKESINKRVALVLPQEVSVYSAEDNGQTVLVRIDVTAIVGGKTVQPKIEILGLRSGLVATISPDTVDVILSGPLPDLQALQPEDVHVYVNLFGLGKGSHLINPRVQLPEGSLLKVESVSPEAVEVLISAVGGNP